VALRVDLEGPPCRLRSQHRQGARRRTPGRIGCDARRDSTNSRRGTGLGAQPRPNRRPDVAAPVLGNSHPKHARTTRLAQAVHRVPSFPLVDGFGQIADSSEWSTRR